MGKKSKSSSSKSSAPAPVVESKSKKSSGKSSKHEAKEEKKAVAPVVEANNSDFSDLFEDIFRRADKNDDEKIDYPEFTHFFGDSLSSDELLQSIFKAVDTDKSENIDHAELINYFAKGATFETFHSVFSTLESLHEQLSQAIAKSHAHYKENSAADQFKDRFYLRELLHQFETLESTVEATLRGAARVTAAQQGSEEEPASGDADSSKLLVVKDQQWSGNDNGGGGGGGGASLQTQVNRLASLIDVMSRATIRFELADEDITDRHAENVTVASIRFKVKSATDMASWRDAAQGYVAATEENPLCRHVYVREITGEQSFDLFEVWNSANAVNAHRNSETYKKFHTAIDRFVAKETKNQMDMPSSWYPDN